MKATSILFISFVLVLSIEFDYSILSETTNFRHYSLITIALISAVVPLVTKKQQKLLVTTNSFIWSTIYFTFILLSLIWSKNNDETPTALIGIFVCLFFSFITANYFQYEEIVKSLFKAIIFAVILSWIAFIGLGKYALNPEEFFRLKGVFNHSQRLSIVSSLALLILTINKNITSKKYLKYTIILFLIITILLTKTRAFTTFILLVIILHYVYSRKNYYLLASLIIASFFIMYFDLTSSVSSVYERNDQDVTELTGRSALWGMLVPLIEKKFILGYGFGVFKEQSIAVFSWYPTHAHNLWLHQLYESGLIGMIIFQLFLVSSTIIAWKHNKMFGYSYLLYLLVFTFLCSITGLVMGGLVTPVYFVLLIFTYCEGMRVKLAVRLPDKYEKNSVPLNSMPLNRNKILEFI